MGKALYRKYRSKSLEDVVGQEHIVKTLQNALKRNQINHAYLFTGPHGVGKTSVARILAHEINNIPYVEDDNNIDIIEIDAASNRRIDEIRDLRDKVYVAPVHATYKVYIIDEVHMLTREAFNALLKTLEEPPAHVVFILATTESHKLPQTIISRTQRYTFKPADTIHIQKLITGISKNEKINISDDAIKLIAEHASGSFRDAVSLLDQASSISSSVSSEEVLQLLGVPPSDEIKKIIKMLTTPTNPQTLLSAIDSLYQQGFQASNIAKQLGKYLRKELTNQKSPLSVDVILELLSKLIEVPGSNNPSQKLEIFLLQSVPKLEAKNEMVTEESPVDIAIPINDEDQIPETYVEPSEPDEINDSDAENEPAGTSNEDLWQQILSDMKVQHNTLYGIVRMARPDFVTNNSVKLTFNFEFHKKRLEESKNRKVLEELFRKHAGRKIEIEYDLDSLKAKPDISKNKLAPQSNASDSLITISNIFGGGELLES